MDIQKLIICVIFKQWTDWYNVSKYDVQKRGGKALFRYYDTLGEALKTMFPQHPWDLPQFGANAPKAPRGYWLQDANLIRALERAEEKLGIKEVTTNS